MTSFKLLERIVKDLDEKDLRVEAFGGLHNFHETAENQLYFCVKSNKVMAKFQGNLIKVDKLECVKLGSEDNTLLILNNEDCIEWAGTKMYLKVVGYGGESELKEQCEEFLNLDANIGLMEMPLNIRPYSLFKIEKVPYVYYCRATLEQLDPKKLNMDKRVYDSVDIYYKGEIKCCFHLGMSYLSFEIDQTKERPERALVTRFAHEKFDRSFFHKPISRVQDN